MVNLGRDRLRTGAFALLLALGLLAILQYRWLREVADSQRSRMRRDAGARAEAVARDFDREITRAFLMLQVDPGSAASADGDAYAERYEEYRQSARWPQLVRGIFVRETHGGEATLARFDPVERRFAPVEWPAELLQVRARLEAAPGSGPVPTVLPEVPALVMPVAEPIAAMAATHGQLAGLPSTAPHLMFRRAEASAAGPCGILLLDRAVLTGAVLPAVTAERLRGDSGPEYEASVLDAKTGAAVYGPAGPADGDAGAELFRLRLEELDAALLKSLLPDVVRKATGDRVSFRLVESRAQAAGPPTGRWRLVLHHRLGSVDRAVRRALVRNLAVAFSVLGLLAASVVLIAASARRARLLAERQIEFVAAVSHELRTPLAAIRSLGDNLADGVVSQPAQVRRYGGLIRDEGLRLSGMVEQVLTFAGAQRASPEPTPTDVPAAVERALAAAAPSAAFERDVPPDLPPALADSAALEGAIANLVGNAVKYAGPSAPMGVRVRARPEGAPREIAITVWDRGPGIPDDEREHVFEAFFRGRSAREAQAPGSGLGLAVVRHVVEGLGGRVELVCGGGAGAAFTIVLKVADATAVPAPSHAQAHPAR